MEEFEYLDCFVSKSFKIAEIIELESHCRECINGIYYDFYKRRNTSQKKPNFDTGILFICLLILIGATIGLESILGTLSLVISFFVLCLICVILLIVLKKKVLHWREVNDEYESTVAKNKKLKAIIINEIKLFIEKYVKYYPASIYVYNNIINRNIIDKNCAIDYLLSHVSLNENVNFEIRYCKYCDSIINSSDGKCKNCGASYSAEAVLIKNY